MACSGDWFLVTMSLSVLCTSSGSHIIVEDTFGCAHCSGMDTFICFCCGDCHGGVHSGTESCSMGDFLCSVFFS